MFILPLLPFLGLATASANAAGLGVCTPVSGLKKSLSPNGEVYKPGSPEFAAVTERWSAAIRPEFDAIVRVKTERDVQQTIKFANKHGKPFLAISGGHGTSVNLGKVRNGIGILMRSMNNIHIMDGGGAAVVGGGIQTGEVIPALWEKGKQSVTTGCDCAGFIAPLMGGGHGWLQGRYGLLADQLISARMVLANGTAITVSEKTHPDLFWAIRGAGHNFGVYTEAKIKIYDRSPSTDLWTVMIFTFTQDKMEAVLTIGNKWMLSQHRDVRLASQFGLINFNPNIDANNPVFDFYLYWQGSTIPQMYTEPLQALHPAQVKGSTTELGDVNGYTGTKYGMPTCAKDQSRLLYAVSAQSWSLTNLREAMNIFGQLPTVFRKSVVMLEGYGINGVLKIPDNSTAYPDRQGRILIGPLLTYPKDASLDAAAYDFGNRLRAALVNGTGPLSAYVNYAHGDEAVDEVYGHEAWRLERLRRLKKEYDPFGRFNFYVPIV